MQTPLTRVRFWRRWRPYLISAAVFLAVTLPHIGYGDFRVDTGLYAAVSLQAWRTGELWTLHTGGQPYFNKPPLPFWIHGLALHLLGPTIFATRLPTLLAGLGCLLATVGIARIACGTRTALATGLALALTIEFFRRVREISLDVWQLLFMMLAVLLAVAAVKHDRWPLMALAGVPIGLALLCKPLMALLVLPVLAGWLLWNGQGKRLPWVAAAAVAAIAVAAPWHISMAAIHGPAFVDQYFGREIILRTTGEQITSQGKPAWYYPVLLGKTYWPWLVPMALALVTWSRGLWLSRDARMPRLALLWVAAWMVALMLFPDRRPRYALPLWPFTALLAGMWLALWPWGWLRRAERGIVVAIVAVTIAVGVTLALLPVPRSVEEAGSGVRWATGRIFGAPPEPHWPALYRWMRGEGVPEIWEGAVARSAQARLYLEFGRWPRASWNRNGHEAGDPPEGALLLYHRRGGHAPGGNEEEVFSSGDVSVTRLGSGGWQPVESSDPGE